MTLEKIKADILQARKDKDSVRANVLNTMIADICRDTKEPSDEQVEKGIKKFLKSIEKSIDFCKDSGVVTDIGDKLQAEQKIVLEYAPDFEKVTASDFKTVVDSLFENNPAQNAGWFVGQTMKAMQGKANPNAVKEYVMEKIAQ